jgi:hypothetical protein
MEAIITLLPIISGVALVYGVAHLLTLKKLK